MFLYQLVNLVLETCFISSKTLKLSKTFSSWVSRLVRHSNNERYDSPIPDFWNKMFKKMLILECLGCFTKSNVVSILDFFDTSLPERCLNCWLVKKIITLESRASYRECLLFKKKLSWHGKSVRCYQTFSLGGLFALLLQLPRWSPCWDLCYLKESVTWPFVESIGVWKNLILLF
jgi:hypothetical protein